MDGPERVSGEIAGLRSDFAELISELKTLSSSSQSQTVEIKVGIGWAAMFSVLLFAGLCAALTMHGEARSAGRESEHTRQLQQIDRKLEMLEVAVGLSINKEESE